MLALVSLGSCANPASDRVSAAAGSASPAATEPGDTPSADAQADESRPAVGDCWFQSDYETASGWGWWEGDDAVACRKPHNSITYQVGDLPATFDDLPWPGAVAADLPKKYYAAVSDICTWQDLQEFGGAELSRVTGFWYLPSEQEWAQGARWIRCDVVVRRLGTLYGDHGVQTLPASLEKLMAKPDSEFTLCTLGQGPLDADAVIVACDGGNATWRYVKTYTYTDGPKAPYPGDQAVIEKLRSFCADVGGDSIASRPDAKSWKAGSRTIRCFARVY